VLANGKLTGHIPSSALEHTVMKRPTTWLIAPVLPAILLSQVDHNVIHQSNGRAPVFTYWRTCRAT
jgi:hypothetical protein